MALIKCKECGNQLSSKAKACPGCGAKPAKGVGVLGWIFVIVIVLPLAWNFGTGMGKPAPGSAASSATTPAKQSTPAKAAPNWSRSEFKDQMTDETTVVVAAQSKNTTAFDFPYNQAGGSRLTLSFRRKGQELDAYLRIDKGQMLCGYSNCGFTLRITDGEVRPWTGLQSTTNDSDMMFVRDASQLETIVKSGKPFRVGIKFYQAGERVFEFDPAGYPGI